MTENLDGNCFDKFFSRLNFSQIRRQALQNLIRDYIIRDSTSHTLPDEWRKFAVNRKATYEAMKYP